MAREQQELFSTEIVNRGVEGSGPYAGSLNFSVRVRQGLPDFLNSVNLKYMKLGYRYLIRPPGFYFLLAPILIVTFGAEMAKLTLQDFVPRNGFIDAVFLVALLGFTLYIYLELTLPSIYLLDFACFRPPDELKISKLEFIELARKSGNFSNAAIDFQQRVLKKSGIGDETYMPRWVFEGGYEANLKDGREEASMTMFGAIDELLAATKIKVRDIRILVVNCGVLNTTPSLSAMVTNHYKLSHNIQSFNLGAMGCAASLVAVDLARDLLQVNPGTYALVVSTEAVSSTWYSGRHPDMLIPNCFFRMGAAAILLSSCRLDGWRSKYKLNQLVRTHKGMDQKSFMSIKVEEDAERKQGVSVSKDVIEVGGHALKANMTTLGPLVLPVSEQIHFFTNLLLKKKTKPYIPDFKLAFNHICMAATSKKALDEIQNNLELTVEYMEASRRTLERFGNTSSSSIWYELAYLEANGKIKRGDRIWQIAFGSGFQCNSGVWKAMRTIGKPDKGPWLN